MLESPTHLYGVFALTLNKLLWVPSRMRSSAGCTGGETGIGSHNKKCQALHKITFSFYHMQQPHPHLYTKFHAIFAVRRGRAAVISISPAPHGIQLTLYGAQGLSPNDERYRECLYGRGGGIKKGKVALIKGVVVD